MAPRLNIPVGPSLKPAPLPTEYARPSNSHAGELIAQGTQALGEGVRAGAQSFGKAVDEAKNDADLVRVGDSMTALQKRGTDELHGTEKPDPDTAADAAFDNRSPKDGYLSTRGVRATDDSVTTYERLEKKRQDLLEQLDNDEQKKKFKQLSDSMLERYYGTIEGHAAQQREQQKLDTLKNAETEAVRAAQVDPTNDKAAQASIGNIVGLQDSFTTSTGDSFAKAEEVQGKVTEARLDALLAQPGGFTDAARVFGANKNALARLGKADEYGKRIEAAKLGGMAAVEANRIVDKATTFGANEDKFTPPDPLVAEHEIAKLPPELQAKVAPIIASRMAMVKAARAEAKEQFVDQAVGQYNRNAATFFASDLAARLNRVDPKTYKGLVNDARTAWRLAGDDSAKARRELDDRNDRALNDFKALPTSEQAKISIDKFVSGYGVNDVGRSRLGPVQKAAIAAIDKGDDVGLEAFKKNYRDEVKSFAPPPGKTPAQKDAEREWWGARNGEAYDEYMKLAGREKGGKPSAAELDAAKSELISRLPLDPKNPASIARSNKALVDRFKKPAPAEKPSAAARARELKDTGLSREDIAKQLTAEGY